MNAAGEPRCPLCEGAGRLVFEVEGHPHHACDRCGSWFVAPLPTPAALDAFYRAAAAELGSNVCWEGTARHAHDAWDRALADAARLAGHGPLLDVGCGAGQFLAFARERGFLELHGLELAPTVAAEARRRSGASVHERDLLAVELPPRTFAAVTFWDVLEHLAEPRAALRRARALLRPGGVVMAGMPSRDGVTLRALGRRSRAVCPPEHLVLATRKGLATALVSEGFEIARIDAEGIRIRDWLPDSDRRAAVTPANGSPYARAYGLLTGTAGLAAQRAANVVLRATRLGDQLYAIARRPLNEA